MEKKNGKANNIIYRAKIRGKFEIDSNSRFFIGDTELKNMLPTHLEHLEDKIITVEVTVYDAEG